ncbi:PorT family protein [Parabacteroides sp. PH5-8]|uniref:PorT family protein n=1 Tax=unclassified Parabacteroides TaxID=2649774 RepID=UPI0032AF0D5E
MKKLLLIMALCISFGAWSAGIEPMSTDTVIILGGKRIEVKESEERMKVRVYELTEDDEEIDDELVFEGHYKDGKSYERRKRSINIPLPSWHKSFDPHWTGFGMGFANFADGSFNINDINGVSLRSGNSLEYNLNILETSFPFSKKSDFAVVTGVGMRWSRYRLDGEVYFKEVDGVTGLLPVPEDMNYRSSRLNITSLTIPLLIEWQNRRHSEDFFISAGVVGVVKTISSSKVAYKNEKGKGQVDKMDGGMNIRPVTMDFLFQAGYDWIGIYAKYSPMGLFESGKGPKVHPVSIGLHIHL